jgi:hypothetical protein
MIRDYLVPALKREFAGWEIDFDLPPQPVAAFAATQEKLGRLIIYDDGDEATVTVEHLTHGHFGCYQENLSPEEKEKIIAEDVVGFLKELFTDKVLLYSAVTGGMSGWFRLNRKEGPVELSRDCRWFLWSHPFEI